jgi:hypothetical protein
MGRKFVTTATFDTKSTRTLRSICLKISAPGHVLNVIKLPSPPRPTMAIGQFKESPPGVGGRQVCINGSAISGRLAQYQMVTAILERMCGAVQFIDCTIPSIRKRYFPQLSDAYLVTPGHRTVGGVDTYGIPVTAVSLFAYSAVKILSPTAARPKIVRRSAR